jgi:hypothetical protein
MMKIRPYLIILALLLLCTTAKGQTILMQRSTDTLWIDSIGTHSGQKAVLDIFFANADTLNAIDLPLDYEYNDLIIDSVSFVGSRIEDKFLTVVDIDSVKPQIHIGAFYFDTTKEEVGPGSGLFARIHMTIPVEYDTRLIPFDTTRIVTTLKFVDKYNASFVPIFGKGYVNNTFSPNVDDSVWIDNINIVPGDKFSIGVHADNEFPCVNVRMPLEYQSDNIVFDSLSIDGTRSFHAILAETLADDEAKTVYLILGYDDAQPLPAGSGPIAELHFTCALSGTTSSVLVDTTEIALGDYYFQLSDLFSNMKIYPTITPGIISVDLSTDVETDNFGNLPKVYSLDQNYPNPFNPTTSIRFALPERSRVTLDVFNILGQNVRQLVNDNLQAGYHSIIFDCRDNDGKELASGVYLYRLKTDQFTRSRKMMLMK